jgi:nucleotide-binding universal stress UspA family protein
MPTSILVALDGGDRSATALGPAHDLATAFGIPITLFRACWTDEGPVRAELDELAEKQGDVTTTVRVSHGFAAPGIADAVVEAPGTVVCLATSGRGGMRAMLLGGTAEEILRTAPCPVLLVGPECSPLALTPPGTGTVLVLAFDGSDAAEAAVALAMSWARALHLEIHLVTVTHGQGERVGDHAAAPVRARALQLVDELRAGRLDARAAFPDDRDPAAGILHYAGEQPTALIVTAAHRHGGLGHAVLGSVALRVVRHAPVPVLVAERTS